MEVKKLVLVYSEEIFRQWLEEKEYPYTYIDQSFGTFAASFKNITKRPDYQIVLPSIGLIAVDVKERKFYELFQNFTIDEREINKLSSYERIFKIPVWFAISNGNSAFTTWYWISLSYIIEQMPVRENHNTKENFRAIDIRDCITIGWDDDLGKLLKNRS